MKFGALLVGLVLIVTAMLTGCARRPPTIELPKAPSKEDLVAGLRARSDYWKSFQARVSVKVESAKKSFSIQAVIVARLPDQLRFEAHKLGQTAGVLVFNRDKSSLWIPSDNVVYTASTGETLIEHFLGAPLPPEVFSRSLIAALSPEQLENLQILPDSSFWLAHSKGSGNDMAFTWKLPLHLQSIEAAYVREGPRIYSIVYDPPVGLDPRAAPQKVEFSSAEWRLEVRIDQLVPSKDPPDSVFDLPLPSGIRTVEIANLR